MSSVAILAATGMLGSEAVRAFSERGWEVLPLALPEWDLLQPWELPKVDVIVNCAAYTNVEQAEKEEDLANAINGTAVADLGEKVRKADRYLIHVSTDFVFNGRKATPYREDDVPDPLNAYGRSKLLGDRHFQESGARGCIARVQWSYGAGGNNFVEKIASLAASRPTLKVVSDQFGVPSWTRELAKALVQLAENRPDGVVHLAPGGEVSRHQVAEQIVRRLKLPTEVLPCSSAEFPGVPRPMRSTFDTRRATDLGIKFMDWENSLETYLHTRLRSDQ